MRPLSAMAWLFEEMKLVCRLLRAIAVAKSIIRCSGSADLCHLHLRARNRPSIRALLGINRM